MKNSRITKQWEWLGDMYMATIYSSSNTIEILKWEESTFFKSTYKTIYFGHVDPLKEFVKFFEQANHKTYQE